MKINLVPRVLFYSSLGTNRKGPWGRGCIEIDIAILGLYIHDDEDDNVELPSQFISFVVSTLTPFRKFLKHITSLINQANTRVTMARITNTNYCLDDS